MRVIQVTKRQYTGKDLIDDKFGRLYELPAALTKRGHAVLGLCLSYRKKGAGWMEDHAGAVDAAGWYSRNLFRWGWPDFYGYLRDAEELARRFKPDVLYSSSDSLQIIAGAWLSRRLGIPHVADLYDNYESFGLTRIPGVMPLFRKAVRTAEGVVCVTGELAAYVTRQYQTKGKVVVAGNGVPEGMFVPKIQETCRESLRLPKDALMVGAAGALNRDRGIGALYEGFLQLVSSDNRIHLLLAGPADAGAPIPQHDNVHYLGEIPYQDVPAFINALDVAVICNLDSAFGRYCFPQKAYEILSCQVPMVAAGIGVMESLLKNYSDCLFEPGNADSLAKAIERQLHQPIVPEIEVFTWDDQAVKLEGLFNELTGCFRHQDARP